MTTLIDPFATNNFTEPCRAYALELVQSHLAEMSDFKTTGGYMDLAALDSLQLLVQAIPLLSLEEIRERLTQNRLWEVACSIPGATSLPENVTFEGMQPDEVEGQVLALCLGSQVGLKWPESQFILTLQESGTGDEIVASTIRDGLRYQLTLGSRSVSIDVETPHTYFQDDWEYLDKAASIIAGRNCWTSAGDSLETARITAVIHLGLKASKLGDVAEIDADPECESLIFHVGSTGYSLSSTDVFDETSEEALPQLIADGVFAELARVAGLEPKAKIGRDEVGKVLAGL